MRHCQHSNDDHHHRHHQHIHHLHILIIIIKITLHWLRRSPSPSTTARHSARARCASAPTSTFGDHLYHHYRHYHHHCDAYCEYQGKCKLQNGQGHGAGFEMMMIDGIVLFCTLRLAKDDTVPSSSVFVVISPSSSRTEDDGRYD